MRIIIALACQQCKRRNYTTTKRREQREKLTLKKYCPYCRKHTEHRETKVR